MKTSEMLLNTISWKKIAGSLPNIICMLSKQSEANGLLIVLEDVIKKSQNLISKGVISTWRRTKPPCIHVLDCHMSSNGTAAFKFNTDVKLTFANITDRQIEIQNQHITYYILIELTSN